MIVGDAHHCMPDTWGEQVDHSGEVTAQSGRVALPARERPARLQSVFLRHADPFRRKEIAVHEGHELGMLLRKAYLSFHRCANSWTLDRGVTADQFVLLTVVAREPGITQTSIVERTSSDPNTVAAVLRRLDQRRLVRREAQGRYRRVR